MNLHRTFEHLVQGLLHKDLFTFGMRSGRELRRGWICAGDVVRFTGGFRWATEIECDNETEEGTHSDVQSRGVYEYGFTEQSKRYYMREKGDERINMVEVYLPSPIVLQP